MTDILAEVFADDPLEIEPVEIRRAKRRGKKRGKKPPYHRDHPAISCRPPRRLKAQLEDIAAERDISLNALLVEILENYVAGKPNW